MPFGQPGAQSPQRVVDDRRVVERQLGQRVDPVPARVAIGRPLLGQRLGRHEREVGDRGQPAARVAVGARVGPQLLEVDRPDRGLLAQLALRGLARRLLRPHEPAGQRERPALRLLEPPREQDGQVAVDEGEHHGIGGEPDGGLVARGVARGHAFQGRRSLVAGVRP